MKYEWQATALLIDRTATTDGAPEAAVRLIVRH
jgi:hypothetical protein